MKIEIEKKYSRGINLFAGGQLILHVDKRGVYLYYMHQFSIRKSFSITPPGQIEDEENIAFY